MTFSDLASHTLGSWAPGAARPRKGPAALAVALGHVGRPVHLVEVDGVFAVGEGGAARLGSVPAQGDLPLLGHAPALTPDRLGDAGFLKAYGVSAAYVAGEMANGIASEALVEAVTRAGFLGVFGAAGLSVERVTQAIDRLSASLPAKTWGINLIHSPDDQKLEAALVELFLARGVRFVSASAYLDLTPAVVRYRVTGIHRDSSGAVVVPNRLMAKVSRVEVARKFFQPAPPQLLAELVARGLLTAEEAELAAHVPMADDVTAEADSGGHTDNRPLVLLLPALQALRDEITAHHCYPVRPRVGAAGGIATPASVATAFAMGAAYVVTGSVNQATREAGTSNAVRELLSKASPTDVAMAPAADMFEMGVKVQVLTRGTLFAVRAQRLYELYRAHPSLDAIPTAAKEELEGKFFKSSLEEAWLGCVRFFSLRDPGQLERAAKDPKHRMALVFRAYLGQASRWANEGNPDRTLDYQVWCGPSMGAFNAWASGSVLEPWNAREAVLIARNLMVGACALTRAAALRSQGVVLPAAVEHFSPRTHHELDALLEGPREPQLPAPSVAAKVNAAPLREPVAIVGMGALFPKAGTLQDFWKLIRNGDDAVGDIPTTHWSLEDYYDADPKAPDRTYAKRGAFLPTTPFDPTEFGIPPSILEATDTSQLLALVVARMALEDAGYGDDVAWNRSRASVLLGVTGTQELVISLGARLGHAKWKKALDEAGVDPETSADVVTRIGASYVGWQENSFPGLLGNVVAGRIANRFDLGGTNCVVDAACASSLAALHLGLAELESGRTDLVLAGGVDTLNDVFMHMCFSKTPALSASGDVRPFSDQADGTLLGEGLGMVVLKRLADAERDGDRVYSVIRGLGTSSDGRAKSIYAPLASGQARALEAAYREAGVTPRDISLLEAHGTGTKAGDAAEFEALEQVYRKASADPAWCALGSVKSQVGHTKAAAGAAGLIKAALALHHRVLPPTIKVDRPNPALKLEESPFAIPGAARPWLASPKGPRRAAVSSFGFGGSNFHVVLEEHGPRRSAPAWDGAVELVALSANDATSLLAKLGELEQAAQVADFARASRQAFRTAETHRLVIALAPATNAQALAATLRARIEAQPAQPFVTPDGSAYAVGPASGSLALLFPGQGAQHVDMLRELACLFPEVSEAVEADPQVAAAVYPLPSFDLAEQQRREAQLTRTDVAQPALGAVERGLLGVLARFGVEAALTAGHSYGELVALHAAGVLSAQGLAEASRQRGRLMAGDGSDRGTMLAVLAPLSDIEALLAEEKLSLVLANRNGPAQGVLSGSRDEIARAEAACKARSMRATRLNVGAAFHSPLVAEAAKGFATALADVAFAAPRIPVFGNTRAAAYPADESSARALLANQLAQPVRFDGVVEALYAAGARTFLEVGPKTALTGMVKATLGDRQFMALGLDAQSRKGGVYDFAFALAVLAARGHAVRLTEWNKVVPPPRWKAKPPRAQKMVVPLTGANHRSPSKPLPPRAPRIAAAAVVSVPFTVQPMAIESQGSVDEGLRALQALQEQTARVHQRFLEGQFAAQQAIAALASGQPVTAAQAPAAVFAPAVFVPQAAPAVAKPAVAAAKPELPAPSAQVDAVAVLLEAVAEATGYPRETLELKLDLEADLGIDSIKRVEILSMVSRRIPGAPTVNPEQLSGLRTLQHVADFVSRTTAGASAPVPVAVAVAAAPVADVKTVLLTTVSELTGYPVETLSLEMDLEADLGIDSIKRVEILSVLSRRIPNAPQVNPERLSSLKTLAQVCEFVAAGTAAAAPANAVRQPKPEPVIARAPEAVSRRVVVPVRAAAVSGVGVALPKAPIIVTRDGGGLAEAIARAFERAGHACTVQAMAEALPATLGGLILLKPALELGPEGEAQLKRALQLAREASGALRSVPQSFFATVACRDGAFGFVSADGDPLAGGLAGLPKTLAHEWPEVRCRAFDVSTAWSADEAALALVEELTNDGPRELGLGPAGRITLGLKPAVVSPRSARFKRGDVVLVTGGARGVTADCARELARTTGVTLVLLGRSPAPTAEPVWLAAAKDEAALKKALLDHAPAGQRQSPRQLGEACRQVLAGRDIRVSLELLTSLGVRAEYHQVDVRDAAAVADVVSAARALGPIRGLVHGAGVLRDKRIEDKRDEDFEQVLDPKLAGLRTVLGALEAEPLTLIALFASVTGRFGRRGQSDYAVANQAMVSIAQREASRRPSARVVALDWGPWAGGMVTPALEATFRAEGVALIPIEAGAKAFVAESLAPAGSGVEVVLGAGFGDELSSGWTLASAVRIDASWPVLANHRIGGREVLPLAMVLEWFTAAARKHAVDGALLGLDDVRLLKGVTLSGAPESLAVWVGPIEGQGAERSAALELRNNRDQVHVRAVARFGSEVPVVAAQPVPAGLAPFTTPLAVVYQEQLFHGPALAAISGIEGLGEEGMVLTLRAHPTSEALVPGTAHRWASDPLTLDGVFQALIVWTVARLGAPSLPSRLDSLRWFGPLTGSTVRALIKVRSVEGAIVTSDIDLVNAAGVLVARLGGYQCTVSSTLVRAFDRDRAPLAPNAGA